MAEAGDTFKNYYTSEILDQPEIDSPLYGYEAVENALCGWLADQELVAREVWYGRPTHRTDHDTGYFAWLKDGPGNEDSPTHALALGDEHIQKSNLPDGNRAEFCLVVASKPESPFGLLTVMRFVDYPVISQEKIDAALAAARAARQSC